MSYWLGLTGSIGMGKSTTAKLFAELGCDIWDADAAVHRMYSAGGKAVAPMRAAFPEAIENGAVSRDALKKIIGQDKSALPQIEAIVHPLVAEDRAEFARTAGSDILVFDIPLLFETGGNKRMDSVACVSISPELQESRVLERGTMTKEHFEMIKAKQMPIAEKCRLADFIIVTDTIDHARTQVEQIVATLRRQIENA
jgi:dephospho-CoA kinase